MAKMTFEGCDEFIEQINTIGKEIRNIEKKGLYQGAGAVADALRAAAGSLPFRASTVQQIQNAIGIAHFDETGDGTITTALSFNGYFAESGFPIPFFVREIEHGLAGQRKVPFVRRTASSAGKKAQALIGQSIQEDLAILCGK